LLNLEGIEIGIGIGIGIRLSLIEFVKVKVWKLMKKIWNLLKL